jgi:hypothetical protein
VVPFLPRCRHATRRAPTPRSSTLMIAVDGTPQSRARPCVKPNPSHARTEPSPPDPACGPSFHRSTAHGFIWPPSCLSSSSAHLLSACHPPPCKCDHIGGAARSGRWGRLKREGTTCTTTALSFGHRPPRAFFLLHNVKSCSLVLSSNQMKVLASTIFTVPIGVVSSCVLHGGQ